MNQFESPENESDDSSGGWIFAYADLMSLLFCFFVILHSFNHVDENRMEDITKELSEAFKSETESKDEESSNTQVRERAMTISIKSKANAFDLLASMSEEETKENLIAMIEQGAEAKKDKEKAVGHLKDKLAKKYGIYKKTERTTALILPSNEFFVGKGIKLRQGSEEKLIQIAESIRVVEDLIDIEVIGHSDKKPLAADSPYPNHYALSSARAGIIAQMLSYHVGSKTPFRAVGKGFDDPINSLGKQRIEIVLKVRTSHLQ